MARYAPPFELTPANVSALAEIERLVGRCEGLSAPRPQPFLRRQNRVRTVQGSVAIEGNTLSLEQVTAVLDGKRVVGPRREVREVENAIAAYELAPSLDPWSERDLLRAHRALMETLVDDAGRFRRGNVGVFAGEKVAHVAPPAKRVPELVGSVLGWAAADASTPVILKSCVVHYELQFIHPFSDGNGRIGRLWQHVILRRSSPVFEWVPFESVIKARQREYYDALGAPDRAGDVGPFNAFALDAIREALVELESNVRPERPTPESRLQAARDALGGWFTRADYMALYRSLSTASATRDLAEGVRRKWLQRRGGGRTSIYAFKRSV